MKLKYENAQKVIRPSRAFQNAILFHIKHSFNELVQISCSSPKLIKNKIKKSNTLLSDMHHIVLYQSFDYDVRNKIVECANAILNYMSYYTMAHSNKSYTESFVATNDEQSS